MKAAQLHGQRACAFHAGTQLASRPRAGPCRRAALRIACVRSGPSQGGSPAGQPDEAPVPELQGDWRAFRARLVAMERSAAATARSPAKAAQSAAAEAAAAARAAVSDNGRWAHLLGTPEKGCLLIARRGDMRFFNNTVVFLCYHENDSGSAGLVLNYPSPMRVREVDTHNVAVFFGHKPVYVGGPVENQTFVALHTCEGCEQGTEIINGVYSSDMVRLHEHLVREGLHSSMNGQPPVKVVAGYAGWGPRQLEMEVLNGQWWIVAAGRDVILDALMDDEVDRKDYWLRTLGLAGVTPTPDNGA